jgi:hypothetical protein
MTSNVVDISQRQAAIVTGVAIITMTVAAVFATDILIGSLIVPEDAAATVDNLRASEMQFRAGIFSWLIVLICDVLAAWGLYIFFRPVNRGISLLMAWLRLVYVAVLGTAIANLIVVLLLVTGKFQLALIVPEQLKAQVMLFMDAFDSVWSMGLVVFGIHLLLLGYLACRSGYVPKIFGLLLVISFVGYLVIHIGNLLLPDSENFKRIMGWIFILPMIVGEVGLGVWLLIQGIRNKIPEYNVEYN